jgi:hypothetical protein
LTIIYAIQFLFPNTTEVLKDELLAIMNDVDDPNNWTTTQTGVDNRLGRTFFNKNQTDNFVTVAGLTFKNWSYLPTWEEPEIQWHNGNTYRCPPIWPGDRRFEWYYTFNSNVFPGLQGHRVKVTWTCVAAGNLKMKVVRQ